MSTVEGDWYFMRAGSANSEIDGDGKEEDKGEEEADWKVLNSNGVRPDDNDSSDSNTSYDSDLPDTYDEQRKKCAVGYSPIRYFRSKANSSKVHPLFAAAARAAAQMPRLQCTVMQIFVNAEDRFCFSMGYYAPGQTKRVRQLSRG